MSATSALPKLIVILGPTASGKTGLSLSLAQLFNGEIVSADSRQVYRGMDVGTAKEPNESKELGIYRVQGVRHHLIDIADPDQAFTLALYKDKAVAAIQDILARGKMPFLVGGTGLYISAVVDNLDLPRVPPDYALRKEYEAKETDALFELLKERDPKSALVIDPYNRRYIIRALEIVSRTGKSAVEQKQRAPAQFDSLLLANDWPREELYQRINARVEEMVQGGLVPEAQALIARYGTSLTSMSSIGYLEIAEYLTGKFTLEEALDRIKQRTRNFARRQLTWWRRDKRIHWVKSQTEAEKIARTFLHAQ